MIDDKALTLGRLHALIKVVEEDRLEGIIVNYLYTDQEAGEGVHLHTHMAGMNSDLDAMLFDLFRKRMMAGVMEEAGTTILFNNQGGKEH